MPGVCNTQFVCRCSGRRHPENIDQIAITTGSALTRPALQMAALGAYALGNSVTQWPGQSGKRIQSKRFRLPGEPGVINFIEICRQPELPIRHTAQPACGMAVCALQEWQV